MYQRLYPFLRGYLPLYLSPAAQDVTEARQTGEEVWLFATESQASDMHVWLENHADRVETHNFANGTLYEYRVP